MVLVQKNMLTVSIDKEYDVLKKDFKDTIYLRLYKPLFTSSIIRDLKPRNFTVLLALASFMDANGNCYPTQRQISEITGISLPVVNKAISELLAYEINGTPIIRREMVRKGTRENSYYTINPISQITLGDKISDDYIPDDTERRVKDSDTSMFKNVARKNHYKESNKEILTCKKVKHAEEEPEKQVKEPVIEITNAKQVIDYYCQKYKEVYGESYTSNFGRDAGMIQNKLIGKFSSNQLKTMIDITISEYDSRWKNGRYKTPSIIAMCTWLGSEALAVARDTQQESINAYNTAIEGAEAMASTLAKFGVDVND